MDFTEIQKQFPALPCSGAGIAIGVLNKGERHVHALGMARDNSVFEIASISKTFTALLLAATAENLDEPVRAGAKITLLDLATHRSGLPHMPDNLKPVNEADPYADYGTDKLDAFIAKHGLAKTGHHAFAYSNLGFALLGQAVSDRARKSYAELLRDKITVPLGMADTTLEDSTRNIQGHNSKSVPVSAWHLNAMNPSGGIRSTAGDMLHYLDAQLHPEKYPALAPAINEVQKLRGPAMPGAQIGLGWIYNEKDGLYWHNGATAGFSSYAFFDLKNDFAAVILANITLLPDGNITEKVGALLRDYLSR